MTFWYFTIGIVWDYVVQTEFVVEVQGGERNVIPFYRPIKIVTFHSIDVVNVRVNVVVHRKCDRCH